MALAQFEIAVKLNAKYAEAWNNLGSCYHIQGEYSEAIRRCSKAIDIKPSFAVAYKNMGNAYLAQKLYDDGYRALHAALRLDPTILDTITFASAQPDGLNASAIMYYYFAKLSGANGQFDAALNYLEKAKKLGFSDCTRITQDPDFRVIIKLPRFNMVMRPACKQ